MWFKETFRKGFRILEIIAKQSRKLWIVEYIFRKERRKIAMKSAKKVFYDHRKNVRSAIPEYGEDLGRVLSKIEEFQ
jgi:hypothetical protein